MAVLACAAALCVGISAAMAAEQAKSPVPAAAPVKAAPQMTAKPVSLSGMVKCEKDAQGVLKGVTIAGTKVVAKDEQKAAAFDGQKVTVTGTELNGKLSIEKIEAVKAVEAAK